ncbi:hypothetical protein BDFG_02020 [Blastomyces dermatitidis ATCC 26199]|nr:hypothetical protein BDFG_02020 [Blastomyces dermatitidis ATCC 26199]
MILDGYTVRVCVCAKITLPSPLDSIWARCFLASPVCIMIMYPPSPFFDSRLAAVVVGMVGETTCAWILEFQHEMLMQLMEKPLPTSIKSPPIGTKYIIVG